MTAHAAPWWFRLAMWLVPWRCREIPEARDPSRIVLRQVALWYRHVYLQNFAGSEDWGWYHSHQWRRTFAIGLWGSYSEHRLRPGWVRRVTAPYFYTMGSDVIHRVSCPSPGHTSLFIGIGRHDEFKHYFPADTGVRWEEHITKLVARI